VDLVPDPLLLRKSGSTGNRTRGLWVISQTAFTPGPSAAQRIRSNNIPNDSPGTEPQPGTLQRVPDRAKAAVLLTAIMEPNC
jgi:hypothetical protein